MNIKVIVAAHKSYEMPEDEMYLPLQVGAEDKLSLGGNFYRDNTGENISRKNPLFCELTGLYWAWKNLDCDAYGLVHYRRGLTIKPKREIKKYGPLKNVLSFEETDGLLCKCDVIVPKKRKYYIENLYTHYSHTLDGSHLDLAKEIIAEKYPEYLPFVEKAYHQTWGYMFNMFIAKRQIADSYLEWLFDILFEMERRIDVTALSDFHKRLFGRVSEILFNVWIQKAIADGITVQEVSYLPIEKEDMVKKVIAFLKAKFFGKKYEASF
ncbi:MAG: DUF4422 domain-containing protein [Lachnospiraceae bacterium]|nr:DUF4422 domain-containing protein [Lachnospiraceae bacterium]